MKYWQSFNYKVVHINYYIANYSGTLLVYNMLSNNGGNLIMFETTFNPYGGIKNTDNGARIELDLPGITIEDIEIKQKDKYIYINAKRKNELEGRDERIFGKYSRILKVYFDIESIEAALKNGVLSLDVIAKEESQAKKIEIKAG